MIKSLKKQQGGFTLIELMVVIVIIGILVAIALPNFIGAQDRAKVSSVKANMHTFQTALETYAVDWGGVYPENVTELHTEASAAANDYWKDFKNPFTNAEGNAAAGSYTDAAADGAALGEGVVGYNRPNTTLYFIYGGKKGGGPILDRGEIFALSNS